MLAASARGRMWQYTLTGTAYDQATKDVLRNTTLMIGEQVVTTDSVGHYTVVINGVTCDKGSAAQIKRCNEDAYGSLVVRRVLSTASITIKTHWKRYAFCTNNIVPCDVQRRDLFVP
ncbi:MAG: hypothetical protein JNL52_15275 [Flavobacteriales bacterium]|nr:hypothetical protein [Flavobacteriales bacterium]